MTIFKDKLLTRTDCDEAGDYIVPNVLSPRDLVFRPDIGHKLYHHHFRRDCADLFRKRPSTGHPECTSRQQMKISGADKSIEKGQSLGDTRIESKNRITSISIVSSL